MCSREHLAAANPPSPPAPTRQLSILPKTRADTAIAPINAVGSESTITLTWPSTPCNAPRPSIAQLAAVTDTVGSPVPIQTSGACNEVTTVTASGPLLLRAGARTALIRD